MQCSKCSHFNDSGEKFCTQCGEALERLVCTNGHPIPAGLTDCPYCPKQPLGRSGTVVEPVLAGSTTGPWGNDGAKPASGTVVVPPGQLPAGGGTASAPAAAPRAAGGSRRTIVVSADEGLPAASDSARSLAGMVPNTGQSPLVGFLVSFSADSNGIFWPLRYGRTTLGSNADSDIVLAFPEVSGAHAQINVRDNKGVPKIWLSDNNTTNGTKLNGDDIFTNRPDLSNKDKIGIGPLEMRVVLF